MRFEVRVTTAAVDQITRYGRYFARVHRVPETAVRWVDRVYASISTLSASPRRCAIALEDKYRPYEIRRLLIGNYLALFTINDETKTVHIISFRHGHRRPRPNELPDEMPGGRC